MELKITPEFKAVCEDIKSQNWTETEWAEHEADDWFQTDKYEGGFDADEGAFCFSYFDSNFEEYWFQIKLDEVNDILLGKIDKVEARRVKE